MAAEIPDGIVTQLVEEITEKCAIDQEKVTEFIDKTLTCKVRIQKYQNTKN